MMYSEFAKAVGCRDNEHNHKVFNDLEVMYMNSDLTKEEIYEYGRKLVDNSKSPEQIRLKEEVEAEISICKRDLEYWIREYKRNVELAKNEDDEYWKMSFKASARNDKNEIKSLKNRIQALKWVLNRIRRI